MSAPLPPGLDLDAKLAEAAGPREDPITSHDFAREADSQVDEFHCLECNHRWYRGQEIPNCRRGSRPFSTDLSTIASLAEEMREKGRIAHWSVESRYGACIPGATVLAAKDDHETGQDTYATGTTPAHALALCLLSALGVVE